MAGKSQVSKKKTTASKKSTAKSTVKKNSSSANKNNKIKLASTSSKSSIYTKEKKVVDKVIEKKSTNAKKYENKVKKAKADNIKKSAEKKTKKEERVLKGSNKTINEITKNDSKKHKIEPKKEETISKKKKNAKKVQKPKKKVPLKYKIMIFVAILCFIILIGEGIYVLINKNNAESKIVYNDSFNATAIDGKNVVVVGTSDFHYSKLSSKNGNTRGKLVKYDINGKVVFEKVYESGISTSFNNVLTVNDGYIVVGTGIFSEKEDEEGGKEAIIIKYDKDGEIIWEKYFQALTDSSFTKVIAVKDGYVVIGQSIYANMELGNDPNGGGIIVKYDDEGNKIWSSHHGGTKSGNFTDIVQVGNDFYVVGKDGADCANIVKFNAKGEYQWHKNYKYTDLFGFAGLIYFDNGLYAVGSKKVLPEGTGDEDDRSTTNTDAVLVKYDLDGNILFEKTFGGSSYERYNSIIAYDDEIYVVGHFCSKDAGLKSTVTENDKMTGLMIRYDKSGNILKKEVFGGSNNDNLNNIVTDGISIYVTGYSNSKDGNLTNSKSNGKDYFGIFLKMNSKLKVLYKK